MAEREFWVFGHPAGDKIPVVGQEVVYNVLIGNGEAFRQEVSKLIERCEYAGVSLLPLGKSSRKEGRYRVWRQRFRVTKVDTSRLLRDQEADLINDMLRRCGVAP